MSVVIDNGICRLQQLGYSSRLDLLLLPYITFFAFRASVIKISHRKLWSSIPPCSM